MGKVIVILKNAQGIFNVTLNHKYITADDMVYQSIRQDKINMKNDMRAVFWDINKAMDEAK